jgi:hypothetical protein
MNHDAQTPSDERAEEELAPAVAALAEPSSDEPSNGKGDGLRDELSFPEPPSATRLNRLAVAVAAAVVSVMLLVIAFAVGGTGEEDAQVREHEATASRVRQSARQGTFYDRPLGDDTLFAAVDPVTGLSEEELAKAELAAAGFDVSMSELERSGVVMEPDGSIVPPPYGRSAGGYGSSPYGSSGAYQSASHGGGASSAPVSPRVEALDRAKRSALAPQGVSLGGGSRPEPPVASRAPESYETAYLQTLEGVMADRRTPPGSPSGGSPLGTSPTMNGFGVSPGGAMHPAAQAQQFVQGAVAARGAGRVDGRYLAGGPASPVHRPVSRYEVREGTLVEAYLVTGVHSDLPGDVIAQVARNVYDSETQQVVLIPRGTRLVGTYDNAVALDQSRLLVAWTRMVFPDGRSVSLPGLGSTGNDGMGGVPGRVNRHFFRAFGNAAMLALVGGSLTYAASQTRGPGGTFGVPTPGEVMAGSVATELSRVATEMLRGNVNRRPTITIPAGTRFSVFVSGDLALEPYAAADGFMGGR